MRNLRDCMIVADTRITLEIYLEIEINLPWSLSANFLGGGPPDTRSKAKSILADTKSPTFFSVSSASKTWTRREPSGKRT